jgi:hypothetical protein
VAADLRGLGPLADLDFSGHVLDHVEMHECDYNWKTFIEVYLEDYHVGPFHPGLGSFVTCEDLRWEFGTLQVQTVGVANRLGRAGSPVYERWQKACWNYRGGQPPKYGAIWLAYYPHIMVEWYPHVLTVSTLHPLGPQKTLNVVEFYYPEEIAAFEREFVEAQQAAYMETCVEDDEIALRMDAGRRALMARGDNATRPLPEPDGRRHAAFPRVVPPPWARTPWTIPSELHHTDHRRPAAGPDGSGAPLMVFDCSFDLMKPQSPATSNLRRCPYSGRGAGRPGPPPERPGAPRPPAAGATRCPARGVRALAGHIGFSNTMQAVVYDRQGANYCGRLWWMLKWVGHERAAVLDGGMEAWYAAGGVVTSGQGHGATRPRYSGWVTERARLVVTPGTRSASADPAQTIVDARGAPRFRGEVEPLDPVAGHIPGALNRPSRQHRGRTDASSRPRAEGRIPGTARRARPGHRRAPLRQWRQCRAQHPGDGDRRSGPPGPVCRQLERVVQRPCQAVRTGLEQAGDLPVVVDIDP